MPGVNHLYVVEAQIGRSAPVRCGKRLQPAKLELARHVACLTTEQLGQGQERVAAQAAKSATRSLTPWSVRDSRRSDIVAIRRRAGRVAGRVDAPKRRGPGPP